MPLYSEGDENMTAYKSIDELFDTNKAFFDSSDKKAWFILGRLYNAMIWESKQYYKTKESTVAAESGKEGIEKYSESYLEKNFFFGRKYDLATFMYFANQCFDLSVKYGALHKPYVGELSSSLKDYMARSNVKTSLTPEEAKYIFAWGMQQWFERDKNKESKESEENNTNGGDE
jgi:CRISPR-associated protein Csh1